jgi:hypothetical protein
VGEELSNMHMGKPSSTLEDLQDWINMIQILGTRTSYIGLVAKTNLNHRGVKQNKSMIKHLQVP